MDAQGVIAVSVATEASSVAGLWKVWLAGMIDYWDGLMKCEVLQCYSVNCAV
jgi:hypothetical protein